MKFSHVLRCSLKLRSRWPWNILIFCKCVGFLVKLSETSVLHSVQGLTQRGHHQRVCDRDRRLLLTCVFSLQRAWPGEINSLNYQGEIVFSWNWFYLYSNSLDIAHLSSDFPLSRAQMHGILKENGSSFIFFVIFKLSTDEIFNTTFWDVKF